MSQAKPRRVQRGSLWHAEKDCRNRRKKTKKGNRCGTGVVRCWRCFLFKPRRSRRLGVKKTPSHSRLGEESTKTPDGEGEQFHAETPSSPSGTGTDGCWCLPSRLCGFTGTAAVFVSWVFGGAKTAMPLGAGCWSHAKTQRRREPGLPVSTSALSAARREKIPVPFAPLRGINRKTGWGRGTGSRRDTELAEWEGNRWPVPFSLEASRLCGFTGTAEAHVWNRAGCARCGNTGGWEGSAPSIGITVM